MTDKDKAIVEALRKAWTVEPSTHLSPSGIQSMRDVLALLGVIDRQEQRIGELVNVLELIRGHGNMTGEDAVWMAQAAAHGIKPERWPMPGEKPLTDTTGPFIFHRKFEMLFSTMTIQQWLDKCPADELKEFEQTHCFGKPLFDGFSTHDLVMHPLTLCKVKVQGKFMLKYLDMWS